MNKNVEETCIACGICNQTDTVPGEKRKVLSKS